MGSFRKIKENKVEEFQTDVTSAKAIILAEYKGLTVRQMEELRVRLREAGAKLKVIKNTLARVGLNNMGINDLDRDFSDQVAFVFSREDAVGGTKIAYKFGKEFDKFRIRAGYFDGRRLDIEAITELANLPGRDELRSRLVGTLKAPMVEFVATLTASLTEFIGTIDARAAKLEAE